MQKKYKYIVQRHNSSGKIVKSSDFFTHEKAMTHIGNIIISETTEGCTFSMVREEIKPESIAENKWPDFGGGQE